MKKLLIAFIASVVAISVTAPAYAHHAFAAEYDVKKPISISGKLTKVEWVNPHGWVYVDVTDKTGKVVNYAIEFGSPNAMLRKGLRKTDFPAGLEVLVKGYLAKDGSATVNGTSVKLPDGRNLLVGGSGTGAPDPE